MDRQETLHQSSGPTRSTETLLPGRVQDLKLMQTNMELQQREDGKDHLQTEGRSHICPHRWDSHPPMNERKDE